MMFAVIFDAGCLMSVRTSRTDCGNINRHEPNLQRRRTGFERKVALLGIDKQWVGD